MSINASEEQLDRLRSHYRRNKAKGNDGGKTSVEERAPSHEWMWSTYQGIIGTHEQADTVHVRGEGGQPWCVTELGMAVVDADRDRDGVEVWCYHCRNKAQRKRED